MALFGRYPEDLKQRVVAGAHYLAGAWLGGAIAGAFVAILFAVLLVATSGQARLISAWPGALAWTSACFIPLVMLLVWANAWHVYRRTAAGLAGRRTLPSTLVIPPLLLLYLFLWLLLIPWCIGLLVLIGSTLLG